MVRCPRCESPLSSVYRTMKVTKSKIRRYRRCHHCQHSFSTTEQVNPPKKPKSFDAESDYVVED